MNYENVIQLIKKYHPRSYYIGETPEAVLPLAESVCILQRKKIRNSSEGDPVKIFQDAILKEDTKTLAKIASETWWGMPETPEVRKEPGFFDLCNLMEE